MRVPQVSERIKEAPAQALRGVFAGIGQLLLITDKLRNKTPASQQVPRARTPEPSQKAAAAAAAPSAPAASAAPAAPPASAAPAAAAAPAAERVRDFDKTGNVRLLTGTQAAAGGVAPAVEAAETDAPVTAAAGPAVTAAAGPAAEAEPSALWPNYDELSIASLRARLRNLDVAQLTQLVEYEQAHANRADVIAMFTRRIAKLQAETTPEERGEAEAAAEIEAQEDVEADVQGEEMEAVEDES